jgi:hypothetical protein
LILAIARGTPHDADQAWLDLTSLAKGAEPGMRMYRVAELALFALPTTDLTRLESVRALVGQAPQDSAFPPSSQLLLQTWLEGALGNRPAIQVARSSDLPDVGAVANAFFSELTGDPAAAIQHWKRARAAAGTGRYLVAEGFFQARAARAAKDPREVIAACEEVRRPRVFSPSWSGAVGLCLLWSAEAEAALGDTKAAKESWELLLSLRQAAPATDKLRQRAVRELGH